MKLSSSLVLDKTQVKYRLSPAFISFNYLSMLLFKVFALLFSFPRFSFEPSLEEAPLNRKNSLTQCFVINSTKDFRVKCFRQHNWPFCGLPVV